MTAERTDVILSMVELERARQDQLLRNGLIPFNCTSIYEDDGAKLSVLVEEIGEVAKALNESKIDQRLVDGLLEELVQVAAVAVAWAESVHELAEAVRGGQG